MFTPVRELFCFFFYITALFSVMSPYRLCVLNIDY